MVKHYWWGYNRYLNSCEADELAADFAGVSAVSTGIAVIAAYFGAVPAIPPGVGI